MYSVGDYRSELRITESGDTPNWSVHWISKKEHDGWKKTVYIRSRKTSKLVKATPVQSNKEDIGREYSIFGHSKASSGLQMKWKTDYFVNYIKWTLECGNDIRRELGMVEEIDINQCKPSLETNLSQDEGVQIAEDE